MNTNIITDSYEYIIDDPDILEKTLLGGGLSYLAFLILPIFAIQGYLVQILKQTQHPTNPNLTTPPEWKNPKQLLKDGFLAFILLFLGTTALASTTLITLIPYYTLESTQILYITLPTTIAIATFLTYITPALITILLRDGLTNPPTLTRLKTITISTDYLLTLTILFTLNILYTIALLVLQLITLGLAQPIVPFIAFPVNCAFTYIIGVTITQLDPTKQ